MTQSEAGRARQRGMSRWLHLLGFTPSSQWSVTRRTLYSLGVVVVIPLMVYAAADVRGFWFGVVTAVVYSAIAAFALIVPRRYESWAKRHRSLDCLWTGPLLFIALGYLSPIPILLCAAIAILVMPLVVVIARRRLRRSHLSHVE